MSNSPRGGRWFVIAKREFLERVRTKWFVIATVLGPVGMIALIIVPALLARNSGNGVQLRIIDQSGQMGPILQEQLGAVPTWHAEVVPADTDPKTLLAQIASSKINGFITIPANIANVPSAASSATPEVVSYQGDNATNLSVVGDIQRRVTRAVQTLRGNHAGLSADQISPVLADVDFVAQQTTGTTTGSSGGAAFLVGYVVMFLLYLAISLYAVSVLRSIAQEKTTRVVELMVAATSPRSLMAGKILGVGAVGLLQMFVWVGMAGMTLAYRMQLLAAIDVHSSGFSLPPLALGEISVIILYFICGYFFYAALAAALGAMVSSEQESQSAQTPLMLILASSTTCISMVAGSPRSGASQVVTMLPFASPVLMPMRYLLGGASVGQVVLSLAILVVSTALVTVLAARIYRVGILMYGKRPSLRELLRWLKY